MATEERPAWVIDPEIPSVARMYDYYLGGKDNFASDRAAARKVIEAVPFARDLAVANRAFLVEAVRHMTSRGIRQFLDIGSGLPTRENVHQVAQREAPESTVVYVDSDPIVLTHARALLADNPATTVIRGDVRSPEAVLEHPEVRARIDFTRPLGLLMVAVLHFIPDSEKPHDFLAAYRARLAPGSLLALSHAYAGAISADAENSVRGAYTGTKPGDLIPRTVEELRSFLDGMDVIPPGIVPVHDWRPNATGDDADFTLPGMLAAVGRTP